SGWSRIDESNTVAGETKVRTDWNRSSSPRPFERSTDDPRVAEVVAHQLFHALTRLGTRIPQHFGGALLQLLAQHRLVAVALEMQRRSHPQQEILGIVESSGIGGTATKQQRIGQQRDRAIRREVTKCPGSLFHVRLELIQRVVELSVPLLNQREERPQD